MSVTAETRLDSSIQIAKLNLLSADAELKERAKHAAEELARIAADGVNRGGVMGHTQTGSRLDELVTKRSELWERYQALVYVRDGDVPEHFPEEGS
jgi:hypothetical protein